MNNILTIMKKEMARFFGDRRMLFSLILPGLMIYLIYSIMGQAMQDKFTTGNDYVYQVQALNLPDSFQMVADMDIVEITAIDNGQVADALDAVTNQELDLLLIFPEGFDAAVAAFDPQTSNVKAPAIEMYYNSMRTESRDAYSMVAGFADTYESSLANKFDVNAGDGPYDMITDEQSTSEIFAMMFPMLLLVFLFSGCMAIAPESIVGEKERGTIATLLVTPLKRSELALGKIFSLSILGVISGASSFLGTMLALPKLVGPEIGELGSAIAYGPKDYLMICLVIMSTVLVIIGAISVVSGLSKSVKEAGTYIMPLMIVVMIIGLTSMFSSGAKAEWFWYLIPIYNSVQSMTGIFSFSGVAMNYGITIAANLACSLILTAVLAKIFDSEKIMY